MCCWVLDSVGLRWIDVSDAVVNGEEICVAIGVADVESLNPLGETGLLLTVSDAELCCVLCGVELRLIEVAGGVDANPCAI